MSTEQPRTRELLLEAVQALRRDDSLAGLIYDAPNTTVPSSPSDRQRIHEGDPTRKDAPAQVAVSPIASGATNRGGQRSTTYVLECTIEFSQAYYERHSQTRLLAVRDRCDAVFSSPIRESVYPIGPAGGGQAHEVGDTGRRTLSARWRVQTHWTTY